jgi:enoyl-CoA hydratase/carnithine racemase
MAPREAGLVARALGESFARAMLLAAEVFPASRLFASGFVTHLVDDQDVQAQTQRMAQRIATLAPIAARANKRTLRSAKGLPDDGTYGYADSREHREGIAAFMEKRKPVF